MTSVLLMGVGALKAKASDYFPLQVGNKWTYSPSYGSQGDRVDTIIGKEEVNGTLTYIWNRQEAPDDNYNEKRWLAKDDTYLRAYQYQSNEGILSKIILIPPWQILKLNPVVGDTWAFEGDFGSILFKETYDVESTTASINVAAGTFNDCVIVRSLGEKTDGSGTEYYYKKTWYAPDVGPIIYKRYTENWANFYFSQELVNFTILDDPGDGWVTIQGTVTYDGTPLCAMVLANGQYMFSCEENQGIYELDVPLDENGEITLFAFVDGLAPFKQILAPSEALDFDIEMELASPDSKTPTVTSIVVESIDNPGWVEIEGSVSLEGSPLCAMVLANGQYMFSCDPYGEYQLSVPLDPNGEITLFVFVDGLQPFKQTLIP
ncbi:hypothetical protein ACFLZE_02890 [Thermodesulfobacteriota bacterium]